MMFKKLKGLLSLVICIAMMCTAMPITIFAAEGDAVSVTFNGNTTYYATIDAAWAAAVALDTSEENKATIKLLADCKAENTLTNTADYLALDTNGKTLTTPYAIAHTNDIRCGIGISGGSLELTGNGTILGLSAADYGRAIVLITGGKVYVSGITIHNTGISGSNSVLVNGGEFYLLDGYILADGEYALDINRGNVYLYSGKIEGDGRMAMSVDSYSSVRICYSDKPLYFIDHDVDNNWGTISGASYIQLEDNVVVDLEYSDNPDGSNSKLLKNTTKIADWTNTKINYLKIQTYKPSYLFSTDSTNTLLRKIKSDGVTDLAENAFTAVHFVDLADYDMTNITYSDYSAKGDGSVKAWVNGTELYIGGEGRIIAGDSLANAFRDGKNINSITGLDRLGTSKVTDMGYMFYNCGSESAEFTLDLGNGFDTSSVTDMTYMFCNTGRNSTTFTLNLGYNFDTSNVIDMRLMFVRCGYSSPMFKLELGDNFNTSKVNDMYQMFECCGYNSTAFKTLDLSAFTVSEYTRLDGFAESIPVTKFIFGKGWRKAALPSFQYFAKRSSNTPTEIVGATKNLLSYDWMRDNRTVTFTDNTTYTITPVAEDGGTVSGGGTVLDGESITLTATADNEHIFKGWYGYTFNGRYEEYTKVCDTAEFVIEDADDDKTYTATFAKIVYYTVSAEVGAGGGTVSGGGEVTDGSSITLTATANEGYTFDGWYDGDTKVCDTAEFVVDNVTADKTYTAKFIKNLPTESNLFSTSKDSTLLTKIKSDGVTNLTEDAFTSVHFVNLADYDLTDITYSDYSASGDGSVKAWVNGTELYIGGNGKIIAGESLAYAFYNGSNIDSIAGLGMLDTSNTKNMSYMFAMFGGQYSKSTLDLGDNFDTSNVTDMSYMFYECGGDSTGFTLDLGDKFNTSKVTDMSYMFYRCGYWSEALTLDLGVTFDTSNVTNMSFMFSECGVRSDKFTLNLGGNFDTSNVTDMSHMFCNCGSGSEFTLDLGDKFNTINVTNMEGMFFGCGSKVFTLNLGDKFDTSNVTNMSEMFRECGYNSNVFTLDLGNKFDTSKVKKMYRMFYRCGYRDEAFTLNLGDKFDTSNVINMGDMFYECGYNSDAFTTLDLSSFTVNAKTDISNFAMNTPITTFIFGEGWANATLPAAGSETGAFYAFSQTDTTVVGATKNLTAYDWASDNRTVTGLQPNTYTVTVTAETGGSVSGGGEVAEGSSITLTAAANEGYTFDGWYDGETKVCDTAEFVVSNVTANKTYTAKFTKNQIVEPEPEPENPDIPYLKWDGTTLTLVKRADASCRVGIVYVGGATFDADNINWDRLVSAGKRYANLNSSVGYAVYNNFTKRTPGTRGNYVAFVKYTKEDGTTTADYITFNVKNAVSFETPALSYNAKTKTLKMTGNVSSTIGVAYIGNAEINASDITWNDFVKAGKKYPDINGSSGYEKALNTLDYAKTFSNNGNYVALEMSINVQSKFTQNF